MQNGAQQLQQETPADKDKPADQDQLRMGDVAAVNHRPVQQADLWTGDVAIASDGPVQHEDLKLCDVAAANDRSVVQEESLIEDVAQGNERPVWQTELRMGDKAVVKDGLVQQTGSWMGDMVAVNDAEVQQPETWIDDTDIVNSGPAQQTHSALSHDVKLPELQVEELTLPQAILADCVAGHDTNTNTSSASKKNKLDATDDVVFERQNDPIAHDPGSVVSERAAAADEPQEACVCQHGDKVVEKIDSSSGEFVPHSPDAPVTVHSITGELEPVHGVDNDEVQMRCRQDSSIARCSVAEQTENEPTSTQKLPDNSELVTSETGMLVVSDICTNAEMKTCSQLLGNRRDVYSTVDDVPVMTAETGVNTAPECITAEDQELVDEPDGRVLSGEPTSVRNVSAAVPGDASNENVSSEVGGDPLQKTENLAGTLESSESHNRPVNCDKESELLAECDKLPSSVTVSCTGNINTDASVIVSNETLTNTDPVHEGEVSTDMMEDSEPECGNITDTFDEDRDLMYEPDRTVIYTEMNCMRDVRAEEADEHTSSEADADSIHETDTSENMTVKPDALLLLQPTTGDDSMAKRRSLRLEHPQIVESSSTADRAVCCETVQETEMCCTESDSVMGHDGEQLEQSGTVVEASEELVQQSGSTDSVESMTELDGLPLKQSPYTTEPVVDKKELSRPSDAVLEHNLEQLKQREGIESVAEDAVGLQRESSSVESMALPEHGPASLKLADTVKQVVEDDGEMLRQCGSVDSETERDGGLIEQCNNIEPDDEQTGEILKPCSQVESVPEELQKVSETIQQVVEDNRETLKQCVDTETEHDGGLMKQCNDVEPDVEQTGEILKPSSEIEPVPEELRKWSETVQRVVEGGEEVLIQCDGVDTEMEHDGRIMKQCNDSESDVEGPGEIVKPSSRIESLPEELLKQSETVQQVVEDGEDLSKQHHNVECVPDHDDKLMEQPASVDLLVKHDPELVKQPETVEPLIEDDEQLPKPCDSVELVVKEGGELLKPSSGVGLVLEHDTESSKHVEMVEEQVVEDGTELLNQCDTEDSTAEHFIQISKQSESLESGLACERKQPQDDELLRMGNVVAEDDVMVPIIVDTVTNHADDIQVHLDAAEEHSAHVMAPSDAVINDSGELMFTAGSNLSLDFAIETVAVVDRQLNASPDAKENESKASIPVSDILVAESEPEAVDKCGLVVHTDRSHSDELELMMGEEKEVNVAAVTGADVPLENPEMKPSLLSDLCAKQTQEDDRTVISAGDCDASVDLAVQVMDTNTEVPTVGTVAPHSVEDSETEVAAAGCHMGQSEHKTEPDCSDQSAPDDVCATLEDASCADFVKDAAVRAMNTEKNAVMICTIDGDAVISDVRLDSAVLSSDMLVASCSSEDKTQSEVVTSAAHSDTAMSAAVPQDALQSAPVISTAAKDTSVHAMSSEDAQQCGVMISAAIEDIAVLSSENMADMADEYTALCSNSSEATIQNGVTVSAAVEDMAIHAQSSADTQQSGATDSTADKDTAVDVANPERLAQNEDMIRAAGKDIDVHAASVDDTVVGIVTSLHTDMAALVEHSDDSLQRGGTISTDGEVTAAHVGASENTEHAGVMTSTSDNNAAVHATSLEEAAQNTVVISEADKDMGVLGESSEVAAVMMSIADEDATAVSRECGSVCDIVQCTAMTSTDVSMPVYQLETDDTATDAVSRFDSRPSDSSVEEGQFDDVESDDDVGPGTPTDIRQLCHSSPALMSVGRATSRVLDAHRSLRAVSHSSFTFSPARTASSRHSPNTFSVTNRNATSAFVRQKYGCSPLLSSPVGPNVDVVGRPGSRPGFPQSPIMLHSEAYPSGTGLQIGNNSSLDIRNTAPASGGNARKRKHSADDAVSSKRSLVADFIGDNTTTDSRRDIVPAPHVVISSGCDSDDVMVTSDAAVWSTLTQAADSGLHSQNDAGIPSQADISVTGDDCSALADDLDTQAIESSTVMSDVIVHDEGKVLIQTQSSVACSISPHEDTATIDSGLLNSPSVISNAEVSERPEMVEDIEQGFMSEKSNVISRDAEIVEGTGTDVAATYVECLLVSSHNDNVSSDLNEKASESQSSVADVAETVRCLQPNSAAESVVLAAEHGSSNGTEICRADDNPTVSVTAGTCHDCCVGDCTTEHQESVVCEVTCEEQPPSSGIVSNIVDSSSSDFCSLTEHVNTDSVGVVTDVSRTDNELSDSVSTDVPRVAENAALLMESCSSVADSSQVTAKPPPYVEPPCNAPVMFCTQDDLFSDGNEVQPCNSASLKSELEGCGFEMHAAVTEAEVTLTASCDVASQCTSQATDDEFSVSQATAFSAGADMFASQCVSQAAENEIRDTDSAVDGLRLFLEMSQEPSSLHASFCSQHMSQASTSEVHVSVSQTTTSSDADDLHLYLEPSQGPSSQGTFYRKQPHFSEDVELFGREDEESADVESSPENAADFAVPTELQDRGIPSQSIAGGQDQETSGEEGKDALKLDEDNPYGTLVESDDGVPSDLRQEHHRHESKMSTTLPSCQEHGGVEERMNYGEDSAALSANYSADSIDNECALTEKPRESAVHSPHNNVDEFGAAERQVLSVIVEENESDHDVTEGVNAGDGITNKFDRSRDNSADKDVGIREIHVQTDAYSPVKYSAIAGEVVDHNTGDGVDLDVTESIDSNTDVTQSSENDIVSSPVKSDIRTVADDENDDNNNDVCKTASVHCFSSNAGSDVDVQRLSEHAADCSPARHDVCTVAAAAAAADTSVDNKDKADGSDVTDSISEINSSTDKDVDITWLSENPGVYSPGKCDPHTVATDVGKSVDDDGSDVTESISGVGSDVGHLSEVEENVLDYQQQAEFFSNDNAPAVSPRSVQLLLTDCPVSVADVQPLRSLAGDYCV